MTMQLSNVFSMMQMQNNAMNNAYYAGVRDGRSMGGGANQLLGPMMMMMMMSGGGGAGAMGPLLMMIMMMMQQGTQQQAPPGYYPPPGYGPQGYYPPGSQPYYQPGANYQQPYYPAPYYNQPGSGLVQTPQMPQMPHYSTNPGYGPAVNTIPDHDGGFRDADFDRMRAWSQQNGSLDGTFVTPGTSFEQDQANMNRLQFMIGRHANTLDGLIQQACPQEKAYLQQAQQEVDARVAEYQRRGIQVPPEERMLWQSNAIDRLYQDGKLNGNIGNENTLLREMLLTQNRSEANEFLKFGMQPPPGMNERWIDQSPFNPQRSLPPQPAYAPAPVVLSA